MKLTTFLILISILQVSANALAQRITLSEKNAPLAKVFKKISQQSGYDFMVSGSLLSGTKPVSIQVKNAELDDVLDMIFKSQPLSFKLDDKTVIVLKKEEKSSDKIIDRLQRIDVRGKVVDKNQVPISGANVTVKKTGKGIITNAEGKFTISGVEKGDEIVISYVGYDNYTFKITDENDLTILLTPAVNDLDQVVVQAYGKTTKRLATGNIDKVTADEIEKLPVMNPLLALQGRVAGLNVTQTNGFASAPIKVELRGRTTINNIYPADPLYIIDGVPLAVLEVSADGTDLYNTGSRGFSQSNPGPARGQSPLFSINPTDIESIEVLKDADATAIYGSRGANGVILITTKKGKAGKAKLDVSVQTGFTRVTKFGDLMNTQEYVDMRKSAFRNANLDYKLPSNLNRAYDLVVWDTTRYTNWQKEIFGGTGKYTNLQTSVSGGNNQTSFRLSGGYNKSTGILAVDGADQRASVGLNLSQRSLNQKLEITLSANYSFAQSDMVEFPQKFTSAPNAPNIFDVNGNLNWAGWGGSNNLSQARSQLSSFSNLKKPSVTKTSFLNSTLGLNYQIVSGLNFISSFGYNNAISDRLQLDPISSQDPLSSPTGTAIVDNTKNSNWSIEPQLHFNRKIWMGSLNVLIGGSLQQTKTDALSVIGSGYTSDLLLGSITSAPNTFTLDYHGIYKYNAIFGRLTYNIANKYILNLTARRDGSSRFGEDRQFGNFGSVAVAWIFSENNWVKKNLPILSHGKLRTSYGLTGSDNINDYGYISRWSTNGVNNYMGVIPIVPTQHENQDYHWSTNRKFEAALEMGFLKDRFSVGASYYNHRTDDQLLLIPIAGFTGFSSVYGNSPALVENTGLELTAGAKIITRNNFSWSINFNLGINSNKLVSYPNFKQSPFVSTLIVGKPLNIRRLYRYTGVDPLTGQYTFEDMNHDGVITKNNAGLPDDTYAVDLSPKYAGGVNTVFSYKSIQLTCLFTFRKQVGMTAVASTSYAGDVNLNMPRYLVENWRKPGDASQVARYTVSSTSSDTYFRGSDGAYTDASFIRLSSVSLAYALPQHFISKLRIQRCSVFINSNNLFTITKYKGIDPETQNYASMPPTRTIDCGINFSF